MNPTVSQIDLLARILDTAAVRQQAIAQNLANVNTPFYQRVAVSFEDQVAQSLQSGGNAAQAKPQVVETDDPPVRADGNTVTLERELSDLTKNRLLYTTVVQIMTSRLGTQRVSITGR